MMTEVMLRTWKTVKSHVPLIKFRKGGPFRENTPSASPPPNPSKPDASLNTSNQTVIEDWQLPVHYRRRPIDEKEMDAINSGGAN